jgi:hypothetical protein
MDSAKFLYNKAAQCRRLARDLPSVDDPTIKVLLAMATEFYERAVAQEAERAAEARSGAAGTDERRWHGGHGR